MSQDKFEEKGPEQCYQCESEGLPEYKHSASGVQLECHNCGQTTPIVEGMDNALELWNRQNQAALTQSPLAGMDDDCETVEQALALRETEGVISFKTFDILAKALTQPATKKTLAKQILELLKDVNFRQACYGPDQLEKHVSRWLEPPGEG